MKYNIFLSYSHLDRHIALELEEKFSQSGLICFLSEKSLHGGADWVSEVRDSIRASERVLILITPRSVSSNWVYLEAGAAWMENKVLIPLIQFVELSDLPEVMKNVQARQIETEAQKLHLVHELANKEGKESNIEISLNFITDQIKYAISKMDRDRFQPNLFIGSGKGGAICAGLFASNYGHSSLKVVDLHFIGTGKSRKIDESSLRREDISGKNVLVVEWVRQTGRTFALIKDKVLTLHPAALRSYAVFYSKQSSETPDYYGIIGNSPQNPWGIY